MTDPRGGAPPDKRERRPAGTEAADLEKNKDNAYDNTTTSPPSLNKMAGSAAPPEIGMARSPADPAVRTTRTDLSEGVASFPFGGVEYFRITNPKITDTIRNSKRFEKQQALQDGNDRFERLSEFLQSMGCVTKPFLGDDEYPESTIYGGMFVDQVTSSAARWIEIMEGLLPRDEGWRLSTAFRGQQEPDEDGELYKCREEFMFPLQMQRGWDIDAYVKALCPPDLPARLKRWEQAGHSIDIYHRLGRRRDRIQGGTRLEWLVQGLLPRGMVVLMGGAREAGKSTMMLELVVAVAAGEHGATWLGQPLNPGVGGGTAVLLTGEDTDAVINSRLEYLDPEDRAERIVVYALDGRALSDIAEEIARIPKISLVVVDPARRYINGDEDGSGSVNDFFAVLELLAQRTGATVVVIHHLTKAAVPTTLQHVRETIRGSGVFLDRPRVILGCFRRGETTVVGPLKSNLPPDYALVNAIHLRRDPASLRHHVEGDKSAVEARQADDLEHKVLDAVRRMTGRGEKVMRAGDNELWARHPVELEGVGRNRIRAAVDELLKERVLVSGASGITVRS